MVTGVLLVSLALQLGTVVLALRLIRRTGARAAWLLIASAICLMAVRRAITLAHLLRTDDALLPDLATEWVALAISALLFGGVARIGSVFQTLRESEGALRRLELERARLELQVYQAQRLDALGRLAGGVAHDFNNLLAVILGCTELLLKDLPEGHPDRALAQDTRFAAERGADLTGRLLAFSRQQPVQPVILDPGALVVRMEGLLRRLLGEGQRLELRLGHGAARTRADPSQLEQVLVNLVVNARDAIAPGAAGGAITLATSRVSVPADGLPGGATARPGAYLQVAVQDTGCGMDEPTRARLFEPFFTTKGPGRGTGLGLSTVHGIVAQAGGFVTVESAPGQGSCFRVHLPEVADESALETPAAPVAAR